MTPAVQVVIRAHADHTVITPRGRIYADTIEPLRETLLVVAAGERARIVLDLSAVPVCDSSGLNLMAQSQRLAARGGGWLRLVAPQPIVRHVLEVTNLNRILHIYDTVDAAAADGAAAAGS